MKNPSVLTLLQTTRLKMQSGKSVSLSVTSAAKELNDPFGRSVLAWMNRIDAGQRPETVVSTLPELTKSAARRAFLSVIEKGLKGSPIDEFLADLEKEFYMTMEFNYEKRLQVLPLKMMMPLLLFILPSVMLLLVGPLLFAITQGF